MSLYDSKTYLDDLNFIIDNSGFLSEFDNRSVLITGATGLIGSAIADVLLTYSEKAGGLITIYAAGRNEEKANERFYKFKDKPFYKFVRYEATGKNSFDFSSDYIIAGASNAYPAAVGEYPVETMKANFDGMAELLSFAAENGVKRCAYVSSSEVYGKKETAEPFRENEYGYIDILSTRASYPLSKRATETLCVSYAAEYGVNVSIVRPGHIYGPTARRNDNRVSSAFAFDAADGKNLVLKSKGEQIRSYCYVFDCATAILKVLLSGENNQAYNISNPDSILSIAELSALYAKCGGVNLEFAIPTDKEKSLFNPMNNSSLNSEKLLKLGWKGLFSAEKGTSHTVKIIKEAK